MSPNSIRHLRILHTNYLQLQTQSNTSQLSTQSNTLNTSNKLLTAPTQSEYLISPNKLLTTPNSNQIPYISLHSPYSSQLNRIPYNSPNKLLTALNSIEYLCITSNKLLTIPNLNRHLTFLLTFSLQLPTLSNTCHFSKQTPYSSQHNQKTHTFLLTFSLQLPTYRIPRNSSITPHSSQLYRMPLNTSNKLLTALN